MTPDQLAASIERLEKRTESMVAISAYERAAWAVDKLGFAADLRALLQAYQALKEENGKLAAEVEEDLTWKASALASAQHLIAAQAKCERLERCVTSAMGCLDASGIGGPDQRLAWLRLLDATEGREPRAALTQGADQ